METIDSVYFYSHTKTFGYMSNFYPSIFTDTNGINFNCSEQYLMYTKAKTFEPTNIQLLNNILNESNPTKIKAIGRIVKNYDENIWDQIRFHVMKNGLRLKFNQNPNLKALLVGTGDKILYEASKNDNIWGIGFDAQNAININKKLFGQNLLGNALMEIRDEFK